MDKDDFTNDVKKCYINLNNMRLYGQLQEVDPKENRPRFIVFTKLEVDEMFIKLMMYLK
jgi:hypothetical protein